MNLYNNKKVFNQLVTIVANKKNIPESAVRRDYLIVYILNKLSKSEFADKCVFKGGTSLSKCYPNSIERFSEDIDLTFLGMDKSDNYCEKELKKIEELLSEGINVSKDTESRNKRNKSSYLWFDNESDRIKLEIGCSVRPDPYSKMSFKSYIHEYLETTNQKYIKEFCLEEVTLFVLSIERTFIDKIMAVKRHALSGTLNNKVRHLYDVVRLYKLDIIQNLIKDKQKLKQIVTNTKNTDSYYLTNKNIDKNFDSLEKYNFTSFKHLLNNEIKERYESLHEDLLYTNQKQSFVAVLETFDSISKDLESIGE